MVFRRDSKGDAFQRQISALRQQLGAEEGADDFGDDQGDESTYIESTTYERRYEAVDEAGSSETEYQYGSSSAAALIDDPELPIIPAVEAQTTVISHNTAWKGDLKSEGSLHLHGQFDGTITSKEDVYILEEAEVTAQITAARVVIAGRYQGSVNCGQRLEVLPTGKATGDFQSPVLVVHEGAVLGGKVKMTKAKEGTVQATSLVRGQTTNAAE
jgi:cytoskeletal protein CcmA (bactofilin family)